MLELFAGVLVAFAALALVLEPLVRPLPSAAPVGLDEADLVDLRDVDSPKVQALIALREIEFDRATGKLSDDDYARLKAKYEAVAVAAIKAEESAPVQSQPRTAERSVPAGKAVCPACGPRPEAAPIFCSGCGRSLVVAGQGPRCSHCGGALSDHAKFCAECGSSVAAYV